MKFKIAVKLKKEIKDIQGETVTKLVNLAEIKKIQTGRYYEIEAADLQSAKKVIEDVLRNPITEEYEIL